MAKSVKVGSLSQWYRCTVAMSYSIRRVVQLETFKLCKTIEAAKIRSTHKALWDLTREVCSCSPSKVWVWDHV